ncbi:MAG: glycosyltransferase [Gammaproteobacteria bacterium]|nr:glycosyltransferase [Gammaproteobacteria bacterium]
MPAGKRLTVLQCLPALDEGGVERGTLEIARALAVDGHRSLVMSAGGRLVAQLEDEGSYHLTRDIGRKHPLVLAHVRPLRRLLMQERVDILHVRSRLPAWIARLAWRRLAAGHRPHFVTTVHGFYSIGRYSAVMTSGERVIAVSESIRDYITDCYPAVDKSLIKVIHRGIDDNYYRPDFAPCEKWLQSWHERMPMLRARTVLTLAARLTRLKGHAQFIDLISRLCTAGRPVHGLIVGGEDPRRSAYAGEIRAMAKGLPITFLGYRADLREIMSVSDFVLSLSSQPESFGRTVLEALALGTPAIGYDHGGVGEILRAIWPRGALPVGDITAVYNRVMECVARPPEIPRSHPFSLKSMQDSTLALYRSLTLHEPSYMAQPGKF